jgi:glyoxylase-like metal-dependent hydrolase (beta-lactamase superfamily II)
MAAIARYVNAWCAALLAVLATACATLPGEPRPQQVAPGVYMVQGAAGDTSPANLGRLGNSGFIVGDTGVIAIDTGVSSLHGQALLAAIARVTDRPVKLALITHTRQEFLFGAGAFQERGIPVHMHRRAAQLMAARCETCLKTLQRTLGADTLRGTAVFKPDAVFDADFTTDVIGRPVRVLHFGHSSGPGDIAVLDERTATLFAGGLLSVQRIPDVFDSNLKGWQQALAALAARAPAHIVPGHGPAADARAITSVQRYLVQLETRLIELLGSGTPLSEVPDLAALPEFDTWDQYDLIHRRNASVVFLRLERELLFK